MKFRKISACVMSLALVCSLCAANGSTGIFDADTVSAQGVLSSKLPENNIHPTMQKYEDPQTEDNTVPYALSAELSDNTFELKNGETIDREDLKDHGIVVTEECGYISGGNEEELRNIISPLATPRTETHPIDLCNVFIPSKLVNGANTIYITYCAARYPIDTTAAAELEINVKYTDGTADSAVKDYLPNHIARTPESVFTYTNDADGETCLNISQNKACVYSAKSADAGKTLIYAGNDIDSLKLDFPDLKVTQAGDTLTYGADTQIPCNNMSADKTYYKLDAGDMSEEEFTALCDELKNSKYGNDVNLARFVTVNDVDKLTISCVPVSDSYNPKTDFRAFDLKKDENGNTYYTYDCPNDPVYIRNYFFRYENRLDIKDFKVSYKLDNPSDVPSYCYLQSLTSTVDSTDLTDPYAETVFPEVINPSKIDFSKKPDLGKDITMTEMTQLSEYLVGDIKLTDEEIAFMDVTSDGQLTLCDLALMKQYLMLDDVTLWPGR